MPDTWISSGNGHMASWVCRGTVCDPRDPTLDVGHRSNVTRPDGDWHAPAMLYNICPSVTWPDGSYDHLSKGPDTQIKKKQLLSVKSLVLVSARHELAQMRHILDGVRRSSFSNPR